MPKILKKSEVKSAKKTVAKKSVKVERPRDNARSVAYASDGKLNTDQIRVLRRLARGECRMVDLKAAIGLTPEQKYSGKFLKGVHEMVASKLIAVAHYDESRAYEYSILAKGRKLLAETEADAKVIAKAKVKGE